MPSGPQPSALRQGISPWMFLLPALVFFVGYQVYPIVRVVWISFTDYQFLTNAPANWVGFDNYANALRDPLMWTEPVAGLPVHADVPAGNHHPAAAAGDPGRPRERAAARHVLPRRSADPGRDPEHAGLRALEVDVQLTRSGRSIICWSMCSASSTSITRRNGSAALR